MVNVIVPLPLPLDTTLPANTWVPGQTRLDGGQTPPKRTEERALATYSVEYTAPRPSPAVYGESIKPALRKGQFIDRYT